MVALGFADGKRQVAATQHRVTDVLDVEIGSAQPAGKKHEQLVARGLQIGGVQGADWRELGNGIHQLVELLAQFAHGGFAPDQCVRGIFSHDVAMQQ